VRLQRLRQGFERLLEWIVIALMVALAVEVTAGVIFRYSGYSLVWYDEVATILLAWVTYYGSALTALKRAHIGVPELVALLPPAARVVTALIAEAAIIAFFVLLAWVGYQVLDILSTDTLVSLPNVSVAFAMSVIPISSILFVIAQVLAFPDMIREAHGP
jgi:TRAP-type C4-dicarboxylate transport system permease small subunit